MVGKVGVSLRENRFYKSITVLLCVLATCISAAGCAPARSFEGELERIVKPYEFNLVGWEFNSIFNEVKDAFSGEPVDKDNGAVTVKEYFNISLCIIRLETEIASIKSGEKTGEAVPLEDEISRLQVRRFALQKSAEQVLEGQIKDTLSGLGIYNPTDVYVNLSVTFPPVNFELADPPYLLVISPREKIETLRTVMLETDLSREASEKLETTVDELGVSSLTVKLGGVATYPSFVSNRGDLRFVIDTAVEEWLHQYLTFRPLGFRYFLSLQGIARDYDVTAIDETLASMMGKEIGGMVYDRYYRTPGDTVPDANGETGFDSNKEMREIRKTVDVLLAGGKVSQAEAFMEEKRQYLATKGYYLRKLNQAYFAFYGSYTDSPTSVDPLGAEMRELRNNSRSIKDFLDRASFITSRADLKENLKQIAEQAK